MPICNPGQRSIRSGVTYLLRQFDWLLDGNVICRWTDESNRINALKQTRLATLRPACTAPALLIKTDCVLNCMYVPTGTRCLAHVIVPASCNCTSYQIWLISDQNSKFQSSSNQALPVRPGKPVTPSNGAIKEQSVQTRLELVHLGARSSRDGGHGRACELRA